MMIALNVVKNQDRIFWLAIVWGFCLFTEAVSHLMFSSSWVVDDLVLSVVGTWIVLAVMYGANKTIIMDHEEIRQWVDAGMPDDVRAWRQQRRQ